MSKLRARGTKSVLNPVKGLQKVLMQKTDALIEPTVIMPQQYVLLQKKIGPMIKLKHIE